MTVSDDGRAHAHARAWRVVPVAWTPAECGWLVEEVDRARGFLEMARTAADGVGVGRSTDLTRSAFRSAGLGRTATGVVMNLLDIARWGADMPGDHVAESAVSVWRAWDGAGMGSLLAGVADGARVVSGRAVLDASRGWDWSARGGGVVEEFSDRPWGGSGWGHGMRAVPVWWRELVAPFWRVQGAPVGPDRLWRFGGVRPAWADDPVQRSRVAARVRELGRAVLPLGADLDEIEESLPRGPGWGWLVRAGDGWCFAWVVP